jgi:hypothetical protein
MAEVTSGIMGPARLSKEEVNYRVHEKCKTCTFFYPLNSCEIVEGNISPDAVCNKYQIRRDVPVRDGEFFMDEFRRTSKSEEV